ncbi:hypothetical protein OF83DRAFT_346193 [Amylostereum chailletii]|nr:hypothetical protein OF83DRAFT_346193 [Amylostereum chailletii]
MSQDSQIVLDTRLRTDLFGPRIVDIFLQALQTGWVAAQFLRFCSEINKYSLTIRSIVVFVSAVALFQTSSVLYAAWINFVVLRDDPLSSLSPIWPDKIIPLEVMLMATPVQGFFAWRCYYILDQSRAVLIVFITLLVTSSASAICATYDVFQIRVPIPTGPTTTPSIIRQVYPSYAVALILPAVIDIVITSILLTFLMRTLHGVHTRRVRRLVVRLIALSWQAAAPPCVCAIVACSLYMWISFTHARSFWDVPFLSFPGKLYVSSLYVNLQSGSIFEVARPGIDQALAIGNSTAGISTQGGIETTIYMERSSDSRVESQFTSKESVEGTPLTILTSYHSAS